MVVAAMIEPSDTMPKIPQPSGGGDNPVTVNLYVRGLPPEGLGTECAALLDRLDRLEEDGVVTEYTVHVWGKCLVPSIAARTRAGATIREQLARFQAWAADHGVSLPNLEVETVHSRFTDETYECIRLPAVVLAEFESGTLRFVTPCSEEGVVHSVTDRLDALGGDDTSPEEDAPATPARGSR